MSIKHFGFAVVILLICVSTGLAQGPTSSVLTPANQPEKSSVMTNEPLPTGARIYVAPMPSGFETYLVAGLEKKKIENRYH
jgi:hypothetical protein